jgi:hypothetical protein
MVNTSRTVQDILQEEVLRERAAVLARAGEKLTEALERLQAIAADLDVGLASLRGKHSKASAHRSDADRARYLREINAMIRSYNGQRDEAGKCFYELIVTREAMGLVHHERLAEIYRFPPKKRCLPER